MTKRKQVYSWNDVTDEQMALFKEAIEKAERELLPVDCDGDSPVQVIVVDRRKSHRISYIPLPYDDGASDKRMELALYNLSTATGEMVGILQVRKLAPREVLEGLRELHEGKGRSWDEVKAEVLEPGRE